MENNINSESSWLKLLEDEFKQPYMQELKQFLITEQKQGKEILPEAALCFNA
ncbi:MAG TPA: uracil-DNA glycosylase, partial [Campylobacterales bacterium]|nr:uracil-DNA glycosylase [Campylobacterales bacterium]